MWAHGPSSEHHPPIGNLDWCDVPPKPRNKTPTEEEVGCHTGGPGIAPRQGVEVAGDVRALIVGRAEAPHMSAIICALILSALPHAAGVELATAADTCREVYQEAADTVPPSLAVALAYHESKFKPDAVNPVSGARGPLQVLASWHCPDGRWEGCGEPVQVGILALARWYRLTGRRNAWGYRGTCTHWVWEIEARSGGRQAVIEGYVGVEDGGSPGHARAIVSAAAWLDRAEGCMCTPPEGP